MILHAKNRLGLVAHPFHGLIVEIDPVHAHLRRQRLGSTANPWFCEVISTLPASQVLHRLVAAAMAEFQLERLAAKSLAQNLVPQADPKNRRARC